MPRSKQKNAIVIDQSGLGQSKLLAQVFGEHHAPFGVIQIENPINAVGVFRENPAVVFVALNDLELSIMPNGKLSSIKPCATLELVWSLVEKEKCPVHITVPTERFVMQPDGFTPLDALALVLSGVSGVWESGPSLLVDPEVTKHLQNLEAYWRSRLTLLYGKSASSVYEFWDQVVCKPWPTTIETEENSEDDVPALFARYSFEAALALAGLSIEEFTLPQGAGIGTEKYANKLLEFTDRHALKLAPSVLGRTLGFLDRRWRQRIPNYKTSRRNEMPIWAREDRFPRRVPCIRGTDPIATSRELYEAMQWVEFERGWEPPKSKGVTVSIRRRR